MSLITIVFDIENEEGSKEEVIEEDLEAVVEDEVDSIKVDMEDLRQGIMVVSEDIIDHRPHSMAIQTDKVMEGHLQVQEVSMVNLLQTWWTAEDHSRIWEVDSPTEDGHLQISMDRHLAMEGDKHASRSKYINLYIIKKAMKSAKSTSV